MAQEFKFGDILRHKFISKYTDLLVLSTTDTAVTVRYIAQDRFHTQEFLHAEVDFKQKSKSTRAFY
jgi:hypothetical protein